MIPIGVSDLGVDGGPGPKKRSLHALVHVFDMWAKRRRTSVLFWICRRAFVYAACLGRLQQASDHIFSAHSSVMRVPKGDHEHMSESQ
jgi:hypothetical protein